MLIPRNYPESRMRAHFKLALEWAADNYPEMDRAEMPALHEIEKFRADGKPDWGGHFYPDRHGGFGEIEIYPSGDFELDRTIVLHELAHWIRHYTGDRIGRHDDEFFSTLRRMYLRWGVPLAMAKIVETHGYPPEWGECGDHWCQLGR